MFLKYGVVSELGTNEQLGLVRVRFPADDDLVSPWMPILFRWTKSDQAWGLPAIGEHVACMVDEHADTGVVLGALYSEADKPAIAEPSVWGKSFEDGTRITYDKETKALSIKAQGPVTIQAEGNLTVDCGSGKHVLAGGGDAPLVKDSWMSALEAKVDAIDKAIGPAFAAVGAGMAAAGPLGQTSYEGAMAAARASYSSDKANGKTTKLKGG